MADWINCPGCGLKHSRRPDGLCPRCKQSVDGTVAGIAKSYRQGDFATFWALLAERHLTPGEHELGFHAVTGPAAAPALSPALEMVLRQD